MVKIQPIRVDIKREADGKILACVPDLAGVMAHGTTADEAVRQARVIAFRQLADMVEHGDNLPNAAEVLFADQTTKKPMTPPPDISFPFFAYGLFRPGQLGFCRLRQFTERLDTCAVVTGDLFHRDGLPILVPKTGGARIEGTLISFQTSMTQAAYDAIAQMEPENLYRWEATSVKNGEGAQINANVLVGVKPLRGTGGDRINADEWDGRKDPLFTEALDVVEETLTSNHNDNGSLRPLFRLQMAYLLLWSSVERYASLRYDLGEGVMKKLSFIADEPAFQNALTNTVHTSRVVYSAKSPQDKFVLDPKNPAKSLNYYYQVRSNITHRGKGVNRDFEIVMNSLKELLSIFRLVLDAAFENSKH